MVWCLSGEGGIAGGIKRVCNSAAEFGVGRFNLGGIAGVEVGFGGEGPGDA